MSGVEAGVDRIVDQIVNPKLNSTFLPEVETVIYNCFGTTKADNEEEDVLNGNEDMLKNGDAHDQPIGGKISARNLSTISSDMEMLNVEKTSADSSPGPGLAGAAGQVSPLTPGASPSVATGAISPLTPVPGSTTPSGTPPPPPPGEDEEIRSVMETEAVEMEVDTEEPARPQSAYTPPLPRTTPPLASPPTQARTPPPLVPPPTHNLSHPGPAAEASQPCPPPPPDSGGEASMSSISDTDLGDVSPPQPRKPPPASDKPVEESSASGTEDEDLAHLMKMKADLMAQLEGDFKLSPEDSDEEDAPTPGPALAAPLVSGGENLSSDDNVLGRSPPPPDTIPAPTMSSTSGSPSPPPAKKEIFSPPLNAPSEEESSSSEKKVKDKLSITEGCKPASHTSGRSPGDDSEGSGPGPGSSGLDRKETQIASTDGTIGSSGTSSGGQGSKETQKSDQSHSHKSKKYSHSSKSQHSRHHSSGSMSKEEKRKMDKLKQKEKEKILKYEEKVKSKDRLKSDKYQALDIFSNKKKPPTHYQPLPHRKSTGSVSGENTPTGQKPPKKEFEKRLDEAIKKELERREEEKKKKSVHDFKNKVNPSKIEDRRRSSDHETSSHKHKSNFSKEQSTHTDRRDKHVISSRDKKDNSRRDSARDAKLGKPNQVDRVKTNKPNTKNKESKGKERRSSLDHISGVKESKPKEKDEINDLLKQKIRSLGVDNIQTMLLEAVVEKTGASISDDEKKKMITKMENMIKTESLEKHKEFVKSPKKGARSSSCSSSSASSTSSSSSDSEEEVAVTKSVQAKHSPKKPSNQVKERPHRQRKMNTFHIESDQSDVESDFVRPVENEKTVSSLECPLPTSPQKPQVDIDPAIKSFSFFGPEDVDKSTAILKVYENILSNEDSLKVSTVTEQDINDTIPSTRLISMDIEQDEVVKKFEKFGGNPRLFKPVPDWLTPYLEGAKVKLEDVEMPHNQEIVDYLLKKESGRKKRKAGWDIVVDWVPHEQPQVKRSKLEKQLGFDFDSSFGCSLTSTDGRRARRSTVKFGDTSTNSGEENSVDQILEPGEASTGNEGEAESATEECALPSDEQSPGKKRRSRDIIAEYLTSAGVERANESGCDSNFETKSLLDKLNVDINDANREIVSVVNTLRNKRKRPLSGESRVGVC